MQELKGKCKEFIEKEICLGCNRLELPYFTGDDNCKYIKEVGDKYGHSNKEIYQTKLY